MGLAGKTPRKKPVYEPKPRKKAMGKDYKSRQQQAHQTIEVVEGPVDRYSASLDKILKESEVEINFTPPFDLQTARRNLELYDGREVYVKTAQENPDKRKKEVYLHGILEASVDNPSYYGIHLMKSRGLLDIGDDISALRRMIVIRSDISDL